MKKSTMKSNAIINDESVLDETANEFLNRFTEFIPERYDRYYLALTMYRGTNTSEEDNRVYKEALNEMVNKKVSISSILGLIRCVKLDMLFQFIENIDEEYEGCTWGLYHKDENDKPTQALSFQRLISVLDEILTDIRNSEDPSFRLKDDIRRLYNKFGEVSKVAEQLRISGVEMTDQEVQDEVESLYI
jgi:hypothetical protein